MGASAVEEPVVKVPVAVDGAVVEEPVVEVPVVAAAAAAEGVEEIAAVPVAAEEGSTVRDEVEGAVEAADGAEKIGAVSEAVGEVSEEGVGVDIPEGEVKLRTTEVGVTGSDESIEEIVAGGEKDEMLAGGELGKEPVAYADAVEKIDAVSDPVVDEGFEAAGVVTEVDQNAVLMGPEETSDSKDEPVTGDMVNIESSGPKLAAELKPVDVEGVTDRDVKGAASGENLVEGAKAHTSAEDFNPVDSGDAGNDGGAGFDRGVEEVISDSQLQSLSLRRSSMVNALLTCPQLHELDITSCYKLIDAGIQSTATTCPLLASLNISFCSSVTNEFLREIASSCPNLRVLDASYCPNISLETIKLPMLKDLKPHSCEGVTSASISAISHSRVLEALQLDNCDQLASVFLDLRHLQSISLVHCHKFVELNLRSPVLSSISISNCSILHHISTTSNVLQKLVLQKLESLATLLLNCANLQEVDLSDCESLKDSVFQVFSDGVSDQCSVL